MSKYLVNYLVRIQESVFEGFLKDAAFQKLKRSLDRIVKEEDDLLRIYQLSDSSWKKTIVYGNTPLVQRENFILVCELEPSLKLDKELQVSKIELETEEK